MNILIKLTEKTSAILKSLEGSGLADLTDMAEIKAVNALTADSLRSTISQYVTDRSANPTGVLAGSFQGSDPNEVGSDLPYARRREFGFSGTDSRGRTYSNDPGKFFATDALSDEMGNLDGRYKQALDTIFDRVFLG